MLANHEQTYFFCVRILKSFKNKFTGWVDIDLSPQGKLEACKAGELIKELKLSTKYFFSSYQKRSIETLKLILNTIRIKDENIIKEIIVSCQLELKGE